MSGVNYRIVFNSGSGPVQITVYCQAWTNTYEVTEIKSLVEENWRSVHICFWFISWNIFFYLTQFAHSLQSYRIYWFVRFSYIEYTIKQSMGMSPWGYLISKIVLLPFIGPFLLCLFYTSHFCNIFVFSHSFCVFQKSICIFCECLQKFLCLFLVIFFKSILQHNVPKICCVLHQKCVFFL